MSDLGGNASELSTFASSFPDEVLTVVLERRDDLPIHGIPTGDSLCPEYSEFQLGHPSLLLAIHLAIAAQIAMMEWRQLLTGLKTAYAAAEWIYATFWCSVPPGVGDTNRSGGRTNNAELQSAIEEASELTNAWR